MSKAGAPAMGTFRARWARCLGLDRNPLRRTVDRVETFVRLTVLILLLAGVPAGLFVAGRMSDQVFLHQASAQRSSDRQVTAVLTRPAPTAGTVDPYSSVQTTWANARWTAPNGTARSGQVLVAAGRPQGNHGARLDQRRRRAHRSARGPPGRHGRGRGDRHGHRHHADPAAARRGGARRPQSRPPAVQRLGRGMACHRPAMDGPPDLTRRPTDSRRLFRAYCSPACTATSFPWANTDCTMTRGPGPGCWTRTPPAANTPSRSYRPASARSSAAAAWGWPAQA